MHNRIQRIPSLSKFYLIPLSFLPSIGVLRGTLSRWLLPYDHNTRIDEQVIPHLTLIHPSCSYTPWICSDSLIYLCVHLLNNMPSNPPSNPSSNPLLTPPPPLHVLPPFLLRYHVTNPFAVSSRSGTPEDLKVCGGGEREGA